MKTYRFKINGNGYEVAINSVEGQTASVTVNGTPYTVELEEAPAAPVQVVPVQAAPVQAAAVQSAPAQPAASAPASGAGKAVTSPLPGVIIAIKVNVGDVVKAGQEVAVLEAMKMENSIEATHDGTVTAINVSKGDSVLEGAPVVTIG
jgi:biotin carboxyl carrier protein